MLIGTHLNPDGDALGSALALSLYLDGRGIANEVLCHHPAPDNLRFLPGVQRVRLSPKEEKHDLYVVLDLDSLERLGSTIEHFSGGRRMVVIDHHIPHQAPGDLRIVDTTAPATALILSQLLFELEADITPDIATCLLAGIVTDTGSFRFRNTNPISLSISSRLLELGGNLTQISEEVFHRKPLASMRLLGFLLEGMQMECNNRICWSVLSARDFENTGARDEDTEGFVNELLSVRTVEIAAIVREHRAGSIRVSLRSRGDHDVSEVARFFGGGGHRNAAGCSFNATPGEVVAWLVPKLKECLGSC